MPGTYKSKKVLSTSSSIALHDCPPSCRSWNYADAIGCVCLCDLQYMGDLGMKVMVYRNDEVTVEQLRKAKPKGILISPGPGRPEDSGISLQAVKELGPSFPLFGVCMGHQCIGQVFGGTIVRAQSGAKHGKTSPVTHINQGVLEGLTDPFTAARYHSLVVDKETFPDTLEVSCNKFEIN